MTTPEKLSSRDLKVGGRYLHRNGLFVRHVEAIEGNIVFWHDDVGGGQCSKQVFLRQCTSAAPNSEPISAVPHVTADVASQEEFTIRDEANSLAAFAFRNGFLEDLHAGKTLPPDYQTGFSRISDDEMRRLMIEASEKLAHLLKMKEHEPQKYQAFIRNYNTLYCRSWRRK